MPRVNHVKKAQQRYATKPTIDPATGEQKVVPVMNKRTGEQKVTKRGRPVFLRVTERDLERPKPMPRCDYPECKHEDREIKVGTSYKWIEPSGQAVRNRHADCPSWNVWDYSSSLSARIAQIQSTGPEAFDTLEEAEEWASSKAEEIRELAEEKQESADNIVEGFGHETYQSEELQETADELNNWADDLEGAELPDLPEPEEQECTECDGSGESGEDEDGEPEQCMACDGTGETLADDPTDEQMDEWREELVSVLTDILENSPV